MINYFGTSLTEAGHYFFLLHDKGWERRGLRDSYTPFNPEGLFINYCKNGTTAYMQIGAYTVFGICGSPVDKRPGSKCIFWVEGRISRGEMIDLIKTHPVSAQVIDRLPFGVEWD